MVAGATAAAAVHVAEAAVSVATAATPTTMTTQGLNETGKTRPVNKTVKTVTQPAATTAHLNLITCTRTMQASHTLAFITNVS